MTTHPAVRAFCHWQSKRGFERLHRKRGFAPTWLAVPLGLALASCDTPKRPGSPPSTPSSANAAPRDAEPAAIVSASPPPLVSLPTEAPPRESDDLEASGTATEFKGDRFAKSINAFACDLWPTFGAKKGNVAFSPLSIASALAMLAGGAKTKTSTEMKRVLHWEKETQDILDGASLLLSGLQGAHPNATKIANRLFGDKSFAFSPPYLERLRQTFGAPLETVDFEREPEPTREHINSWVTEQTEKRIQNLMPPGSVDATTRLVLVNAIAFRGAWQNPFVPSATKDEPFHTSRSTSRDVPTMHTIASFYFDARDHAKIIALPYGFGGLRMVLVVPDAIDGLPALEKSIRPATLDRWVAELSLTRVDLALPKFEIASTESISLKGVLQSLGMTSAFDAAHADFTGIAPANAGNRIHLHDVFHKAFVKTDEIGTEAAAATGASVRELAAINPLVVRVDRPFLFFLQDGFSSVVLFMGRVADPV